ncbi:hypothetical protein SynSYN20_00708 [Synechococcus sp. SYN20]|uniref:hypothetical protein n=1 Tax=Synechococcus sp. SYN20 TaxID=1050714 RepID=UPI001646651F|nr:hypothetical protein [Synechococcus sp. SYN20]QNJ25050.1 hypothetical protein SynSYN20_00708 [Synechococcus sp. SYN20]
MLPLAKTKTLTPMKRALIFPGIVSISILVPTSAVAGSLNNSFGASSSEFTGTSTGTSVINVISKINIDNEINIESHTHSASFDIDANNARLINRGSGVGYYSDSAGMSAGSLGFTGERSSNESSDTKLSANANINIKDSKKGIKDIEKPYRDDHSTGSDTYDSQRNYNGHGQKNKGKPHSNEITERELMGTADSEYSTMTTKADQGSIQGDTTAGGSFSTTGLGWAGMQSETAVDGQFSASVQSGTTDIHGTIREYGLTTTTVDLTSITTGTSFGSEAKSFRNASF